MVKTGAVILVVFHFSSCVYNTFTFSSVVIKVIKGTVLFLGNRTVPFSGYLIPARKKAGKRGEGIDPAARNNFSCRGRYLIHIIQYGRFYLRISPGGTL